MTLMDVQPDLLRCPDLVVDDYMAAISRIKPSVNADDIQEHIKWTEEFGQDGWAAPLKKRMNRSYC